MTICTTPVVKDYPRILITETVYSSGKKEGKNTLRCSSLEWDENDNVYFQVCGSNPYMACISAIDKRGGARRFLYSKTKSPDEKRLLTMSGYRFDGSIEVHPWEEGHSPDLLTPEDKEAIVIINQVELVHMMTFKRALAKHQKRIKGLDLDLMSTAEAEKTYSSILYNISAC